MSPALAGEFFTTEPPGKPIQISPTVPKISIFPDWSRNTHCIWSSYLSGLLQSERVSQSERVKPFIPSISLWGDHSPRSVPRLIMNSEQSWHRNDVLYPSQCIRMGGMSSLPCSSTGEVIFVDLVICVCQVFLCIWLVSERRCIQTVSVSSALQPYLPLMTHAWTNQHWVCWQWFSISILSSTFPS